MEKRWKKKLKKKNMEGAAEPDLPSQQGAPRLLPQDAWDGHCQGGGAGGETVKLHLQKSATVRSAR